MFNEYTSDTCNIQIYMQARMIMNVTVLKGLYSRIDFYIKQGTSQLKLVLLCPLNTFNHILNPTWKTDKAVGTRKTFIVIAHFKQK